MKSYLSHTPHDILLHHIQAITSYKGNGKGSNPKSWDNIYEWREHIRWEEGFFGNDTVILLNMVLFNIPIDITNWPTNISARVILVDGINKLELTNLYGFFVTGMGIESPPSSPNSDLSYAIILLTLWGFKIDWNLTTGGLEVSPNKKGQMLAKANAVIVMDNDQFQWSDPRSPEPQIRDAPMVTEEVALDLRQTGTQDNTENREETKEVIVYDVEKVVNGKVVKVSKDRATVKGRNKSSKSVKDVVTVATKEIQDVCRAARSELHPKTCRQSQPHRVTPKSEEDTHYNIVARLA